MEAEGEDGEKPEMAESVTQKLKEAEINESDSFLLTRNLLGAAIFDINRYIRGLFPEKYFNDESIRGLDTKLITPMDAESRRLFDLMEKGVYDALQRKYLKTLMFCIRETEDDGPMIEKYERAMLPLELSLCNGSFEVPWNPSGDSIADLILLLGDKDLTVVKLLAEKTKDVDVVAHAVVCTFLQPPVYEPNFFRGCTEEEAVAVAAQDVLTKNPLRMEIGNVNSKILLLTLEVKNVFNTCEDENDGKSTRLDDQPSASDSEITTTQENQFIVAPLEKQDKAARAHRKVCFLVSGYLGFTNSKTLFISEADKNQAAVIPETTIFAMILTKMKETAESYHGRKLKDAVVTTAPCKLGKFDRLSMRYSRQVSQPSTKRKHKASQDSDDDSTDDDSTDDNSRYFNRDDYDDIPDEERSDDDREDDEESSDDDREDDEESSDDDREDDENDSEDDVDPAGIMIEAPDLRQRLQLLGDKVLHQLGEHVPEQVLEGNRVVILSQIITNNVARILLDEDRFTQVENVINADTQLKLSSYGQEACIYWKADVQEYRQYATEEESGKRITKAAGYIRDQGFCRVCWSFGATDLISATIVLDGFEDEYKSLSPMHLCRKVAPMKRERRVEKNESIHYCYGHNMEDALKYVQENGIPYVEWDGGNCSDENGFEDAIEDRFYVKRIIEYPTLAEALERLKTHPVAASLAAFDGWEDAGIYRGPLNGAEIDGDHEVLMVQCLEKDGELVVKCKCSNGKTIGYEGYIFVSLEVMMTWVGILRKKKEENEEEPETEICHDKPRYLLSDFYSVEMQRRSSTTVNSEQVRNISKK